MSIELKKRSEELVLVYRPEMTDWLGELLDIDPVNENAADLRSGADNPWPISLWGGVFEFERTDLRDAEYEGDYSFTLGSAQDDAPYYRIEGRKLKVPFDVYFSTGMRIDKKYFGIGPARRKAALFQRIAKVVDPDTQRVIIGGDHEDAMPEGAFLELVANLPTSYEFERYANYRMGQLVGEYFNTERDFEQVYNKYRANKAARVGKMHSSENGREDRRIAIQQAELLRSGLDRLDYLLDNTDPYAVDEREWRDAIYPILRIVFPQYVFAKADVKIPDHIDPDREKRFIDFLLADAAGNVDVLEIKRAFPKSSLIRKTPYRDNFIAARELTGGVMQIEKYINHLLNWGIEGEKKLYERYKNELPKGLDELRFLNPKGLLIIGYCPRDAPGKSGFTKKEAYDFDLIRRHYARIIDIITYNDLRERFKRIIASLELEIGD